MQTISEVRIIFINIFIICEFRAFLVPLACWKWHLIYWLRFIAKKKASTTKKRHCIIMNVQGNVLWRTYVSTIYCRNILPQMWERVQTTSPDGKLIRGSWSCSVTWFSFVCEKCIRVKQALKRMTVILTQASDNL